jgi:DNA segregation ATPase FtsK/SpoIIIE-like protein
MTERENNRKLREGMREIRFGLQELLVALSNDHSIPSAPSEAKQDFFDQIVESNQLSVDDALYRRALSLVTGLGYASTLVLQTQLEISYQQAIQLVADLERHHLIAPAHGFRPHKVLPAAYELRRRFESADCADPFCESAKSAV